jgi:hypothetical protein
LIRNIYLPNFLSNFIYIQKERFLNQLRRGVAYGERVGRYAPPAFENFVLNTKPEKSTFSGLFSYSI